VIVEKGPEDIPYSGESNSGESNAEAIQEAQAKEVITDSER
jgi:hypothetical protein